MSYAFAIYASNQYFQHLKEWTYSPWGIFTCWQTGLQKISGGSGNRTPVFVRWYEDFHLTIQIGFGEIICIFLHQFIGVSSPYSLVHEKYDYSRNSTGIPRIYILSQRRAWNFLEDFIEAKDLAEVKCRGACLTWRGKAYSMSMPRRKTCSRTITRLYNLLKSHHRSQKLAWRLRGGKK